MSANFPAFCESILEYTSQTFSGYSLITYGFASITLYASWRVLYRLILYPVYFSPLRSIPGPPIGHIIYGQFPAIINGEAGIPQRDWVKKYGPIVRVVGPIGIERLIFVSPDAVQKILVTDWIDYPRPKFMRDVLGFVTGYGLLTVTGNEHKQMRKSMNPAFSIPNLMAQSDMYYDSIETLIQILNQQIENEEKPKHGKILPMYEWMSKVTLDIICETAFGYKSDSLHNPHNELADAYENIINLQSGRLMARFIAVVSIPGMPRFLNSEWAYNHKSWFMRTRSLSSLAVVLDSMYRIRQVSAAMLQDKINDSIVTQSDTEAKRDIMSLLVRARKVDLDKENHGYAMSDATMMDQVLTFLGAGHETTASGLSWTLWLLAKDPESQERLRKEVSPLFATNSRPDYRSLKDLQWLDCIIMESLRVLPPVPMTFRQAAKTDYIDGVLVPKGTILYIPIRVINTWKEVWGEDAEEFRPSRWLNLPKHYNPAFSTLSFIVGPHACIGKTMAIIEMKAVLAALIVKFKFEPAYPGQIPQPTSAITMKPKDNMPLRVTKI